MKEARLIILRGKATLGSARSLPLAIDFFERGGKSKEATRRTWKDNNTYLEDESSADRGSDGLGLERKRY